MPSGDGAILAFLGEGGEAASMVEPWATILRMRGFGSVISRTGEIWKGAPGCSLSTTTGLIEGDPDLVQRVTGAYVRGGRFVREHPDEASAIAAEYIGVRPEYVREALHHNHPDVNAVRNGDAMGGVLELMRNRGYVTEIPAGFVDLRFLDKALEEQDG
jgi:ABC-type nitrate/sulfonate/bicarbonate transport system substrate-binding protein